MTSAVVPVRLLHLTDLHLCAEGSCELYGVNTEASFRATLTSGLVEAPGPLDAVLVTGDIAEDGRRETYERFRRVMSAVDVPVMCVPGNHEDRAAMSSLLDGEALRCCGSAILAGWRIVMLDSHVPGEDSGWLDDAELARLERELAAGADQHVLVGLHHHPIPVGSPWLDAVALKNAASLISLLTRYRNVRGVLWGHVHQASDRFYRGIRMMSTPSTCAQFTPGTRTCLLDLRPPGFRWLQLMPSGEIETAVVWLDDWRKAERPPDSRREAAV